MDRKGVLIQDWRDVEYRHSRMCGYRDMGMQGCRDAGNRGCENTGMRDAEMQGWEDREMQRCSPSSRKGVGGRVCYSGISPHSLPTLRTAVLTLAPLALPEMPHLQLQYFWLLKEATLPFPSFPFLLNNMGADKSSVGFASSGHKQALWLFPPHCFRWLHLIEWMQQAEKKFPVLCLKSERTGGSLRLQTQQLFKAETGGREGGIPEGHNP